MMKGRNKKRNKWRSAWIWKKWRNEGIKKLKMEGRMKIGGNQGMNAGRIRPGRVGKGRNVGKKKCKAIPVTGH
jgi:hypothetical protein